MQERTLDLTLSQVGVILHSYELYFSNLYTLATEQEITYENIFGKYDPVMRLGCLSGFCVGDYSCCLLREVCGNYEVKRDEDCYLALINNFESALYGFPKTMRRESFAAYRKYFLRLVELEILLDHLEWMPVHDLLYELADQELTKENLLFTPDNIVNTIQVLEFYANIHLIANYPKDDFQERLEWPLFPAKLSEELTSFLDELQGNKVVLGDKVLLKDIQSRESIWYQLVKEDSDGIGDDTEDSNLQQIRASTPLGKALLGKKISEGFTVKVKTHQTLYRVLDIEKEHIYASEVELKVIADKEYIINRQSFYPQGTGSADIDIYTGRRMMTPLRETGYDIWDGSRERTEEERWNILINHSIPQLGIEEVIFTIRSHIEDRSWSGRCENALEKWGTDLRKLVYLLMESDWLDMEGMVDYFSLKE